MPRRKLAAAARIAAAWVPAVLLVLIFVPQGWAKFSDTSGWATAFRGWGYPVWFRMAVGAIELSAAATLLWGRTAIVGATLIFSVMLGAIATHLMHEGGRHMTSEFVPLVLASIVVLVRRRDAGRLLGVVRRES